MTQTRFRTLIVGLVAWAALAGFVSCSSSDQAPGEGRVEHPDPGAKASPTPTRLAPPPDATSETSGPLEPPPPPSEMGDATSGFTQSPLDKAIAKDKPARPWSKNVPKRRCTKDDECGDGFCDRGRCAAIWTYTERYGQRCEGDRWCFNHLCIDGRCRSCASDTDCERLHLIQDGRCTPDTMVPDARECSGVIGSVVGTPSPGPPPQAPKQ